MRILLSVLTLAGVAFAQLAPPNATGVTMGHVHFVVKDIGVQMKFFTEALGGKVVKNEKLEMIQFPGVFVILRQGEPTDVPAGSIVNHFGLVWKDLPSWLAKWKAAGVKVEQGGNPNQGYVVSPADGIRVEFYGDPKIAAPVEMHHIHFWPTDSKPIREWYGKLTGGVVGQRERVSNPGLIDSVDIPMANLSFSPTAKTQAPTVGRSLDHIGFEVRDLPAFVKRLEAMGIKMDEQVRTSANASKLRVAFLTDPWGTRIELTEGLQP